MLDTHVLLWAAAGDERLSTRVAEMLLDPANHLYLSVVSAWEIVLKWSGIGAKGGSALELLSSEIRRFSLEVLPLQLHHVAALDELPPLHKDPFDRILVAQARCEGLPLLTRDRRVQNYPVETIW